MTTAERPRPHGPRRRRLRSLVLPVAVGLLGTLTACSDAHTPEEKAWVDDGVDPRVVTVFVPPRFGDRIQPLLDGYADISPRTRVVVAAAPDAEAADRIASNPGPSVWIGDPGYLAEEHPEPETVVTVAQDPLARAWASASGHGAPTLPDFGGGDRTTGLCAREQPCGAAAWDLLAEEGIDVAPTETFEDGDALARALRDGDVTAALVPRSFAAAYFPGVGSEPLEAPDHRPRPIQVWRFGDEERVVDLAEWLVSPAAVRELQGRLWVQPPTDVARSG